MYNPLPSKIPFSPHGEQLHLCADVGILRAVGILTIKLPKQGRVFGTVPVYLCEKGKGCQLRLSVNAYSLVVEVLKKLFTVALIYCHMFITELAKSMYNLTSSAMGELHLYKDSEKALLSSSSNGTTVLRVLQALSALVVTLHLHEKKDLRLLKKDYTEALSQLAGINVSLEYLWHWLDCEG